MQQGDIVSYGEICMQEGVTLQRGMNFRLKGKSSVILMSVRKGAPYADRLEDDGRVLIYEGHDVPRRKDGPDPKTVDQTAYTDGGTITENGRFFEAACRFKNGQAEPERVRVYEKLRPGIWAYNGLFRLADAWQEQAGIRSVFKFRLELIDQLPQGEHDGALELDHSRVIPSAVKLEVWRRDKARCVMCGARENLHFDHIIPHSKGGSSLVSENVQLLCARHNLEKHDRIE